jgi:hypothetical protein
MESHVMKRNGILLIIIRVIFFSSIVGRIKFEICVGKTERMSRYNKETRWPLRLRRMVRGVVGRDN